MALPDRSAPALPDARSACILVVEDDQRVMTATVDALSELGHDPVSCGDPAAARALLAHRPDIDFVLSDVVMPGMTGPELVAQLRRDRPDLRAVFATGYTGEVTDAAAFGDDIVLRKPFTIATLGDAVARVVATLPPPEPALVTSQAA